MAMTKEPKRHQRKFNAFNGCQKKAKSDIQRVPLKDPLSADKAKPKHATSTTTKNLLYAAGKTKKQAVYFLVV